MNNRTPGTSALLASRDALRETCKRLEILLTRGDIAPPSIRDDNNDERITIAWMMRSKRALAKVEAAIKRMEIRPAR